MSQGFNQTVRLLILVLGILGVLYITATHFDESEWKGWGMIVALLAGSKADEKFKVVEKLWKGASTSTTDTSGGAADRIE